MNGVESLHITFYAITKNTMLVLHHVKDVWYYFTVLISLHFMTMLRVDHDFTYMSFAQTSISIKKNPLSLHNK